MDFVESRPHSRRGNEERTQMLTALEKTRPPTRQLSSRGITAGRPASVLTPNASRINTKLIPHKAGFMQAGMADRPVTQQGISGMRTGTAQGQRRQVLDKRYYEGLLRQKMTAINNEVHRLTANIEIQRHHESATDVYNTKVKEVAQELIELQGEHSAFNQVLDKIHTGRDFTDVLREVDQLQSDNDRDAARLDQLYQQNKKCQAEVIGIEDQILKEKSLTQKVLDEMDEATQQKYQEISTRNNQLLANINNKQEKLEQLKAVVSSLHDQISGSQIKEEAVLLHQKLRERQEKKRQMEEDSKRKGTPAQEREELLRKVRDDNAEMAAMERQASLINQKTNGLHQELEIIQQDIEETSSDRHHKLKELRQREETMEKFLSSFEDAQTAEQARIQILEGKVEVALQQMSRNMISPSALPSAEEYVLLRDNLEVKQEELEKTKYTTEELNVKQAKLRDNVERIDELESKIINEINELKDKISQMDRDMILLSNLDALRNSSHTKRAELLETRDSLLNKKMPIETVEELTKKLDQLNKSLADNDTYTQISTLEKKLQIIVEANRSLSSQMATKKLELNFEEHRKEALNLLSTFNSQLVKRLTRKS